MAQPPRAQLRSLLTDLIDLDGLGIFARDHYGSLIDDVRWDEGMRVAAESFVAALQDRHLADEKLFEHLLESRPAVRERIEAVQAACRPLMPSISRSASALRRPRLTLEVSTPRTPPRCAAGRG